MPRSPSRFSYPYWPYHDGRRAIWQRRGHRHITVVSRLPFSFTAKLLTAFHHLKGKRYVASFPSKQPLVSVVRSTFFHPPVLRLADYIFHVSPPLSENAAYRNYIEAMRSYITPGYSGLEKWNSRLRTISHWTSHKSLSSRIRGFVISEVRLMGLPGEVVRNLILILTCFRMVTLDPVNLCALSPLHADTVQQFWSSSSWTDDDVHESACARMLLC
ncbi:hypothetical protein EDC04DRAFT_1228285 [Pisolithus marmoratus]|nr:hypothetical protein EDC04DRAFT_1228285 [Pisolithus marmoratus]